MDLDSVNFRQKCSDFDTSGNYCNRCTDAFAGTAFLQLFDPKLGYLHYDLATLKKRQGESCPLCRGIIDCFKGSRLYYRSFSEKCVFVVLRIQLLQTCQGLSRGVAGGSSMHVLLISLHSDQFHEAVKDIYYTLDIFAEESM